MMGAPPSGAPIAFVVGTSSVARLTLTYFVVKK